LQGGVGRFSHPPSLRRFNPIYLDNIPGLAIQKIRTSPLGHISGRFQPVSRQNRNSGYPQPLQHPRTPSCFFFSTDLSPLFLAPSQITAAPDFFLLETLRQCICFRAYTFAAPRFRSGLKCIGGSLFFLFPPPRCLSRRSLFIPPFKSRTAPQQLRMHPFPFPLPFYLQFFGSSAPRSPSVRIANSYNVPSLIFILPPIIDVAAVLINPPRPAFSPSLEYSS